MKLVNGIAKATAPQADRPNGLLIKVLAQDPSLAE
jgi:hypothetical protein